MKSLPATPSVILLPKALSTVLALGGLVFGSLADSNPPGADVDYYGLAKGQAYRQLDDSSTVPSEFAPYFFNAFAQGAYPGSLTATSLVNPAGQTNIFSPTEEGGWEFNFFADFETKTDLDAAFPRGRYTFELATLAEGRQRPVLLLPNDAYPNVPRLANWAAAQTINAYADFTLSWNVFSGGGAEDFISVIIRDTNTFAQVFATPDLLKPGTLDGTATSMKLPAGTLQPGRGYVVELLFLNVSALDYQAYPGARGLTGFARRIRSSLATASPPTAIGQVQFANATFTVSESNETATISLVRLGGSQGELTALVAATNGTATAGADFIEETEVVSFVDGQTTATFTFPLLDDTRFEGPETIRLVIRFVAGEGGAGQTNALLTLVDDDPPANPGILQWNLPARTTAESPHGVTLHVLRTGGADGEVTVDYATISESAIAGDDFFPLAGTLVFPAGISRRTLPLKIIPDALDETNETFTVRLSNPSGGALLGAIDSTQVTIVDNDLGGIIQFASSAVSVSETSEVAVITVRRTGGKAGGVSVDYFTVPDTATEGADFIATSGTLQFAANQMSQSFQIPLVSDHVPDGDKTVLLRLRNPAGGARFPRPFSATNATLHIIDDVRHVQFASATYTTNEAGRAIILEVIRSGSPGTVSVRYATASGSATQGQDYRSRNGLLTFTGSATTRRIIIPILMDSLTESDETFTVTLSDPSPGLELGPRATATVTILGN
jgi:hypothetical protein